MEAPDTPVQTNRKKITKRTKVALWLVLGPTILFFITIILYALVNFIFAGTATTGPTPECYAAQQSADPGTDILCNDVITKEEHPVASFINVVLFAVGSISVFAWLPGLIIGAVLLIKRPKNT